MRIPRKHIPLILLVAFALPVPAQDPRVTYRTTDWQQAALLLGDSAKCISLAPDGRPIVPTNRGLLYYDKEDQWKEFPSKNLPRPVQILYTSKSNTVFAAKDSGYLFLLKVGSTTWKKTSLYLKDPTSMVSARPEDLYVSDGKMVFYSSDDGATWRSRSSGLGKGEVDSGEDEQEKDFSILSLCCDSIGNIYAGSSGFGVFRLSAGDTVWQSTRGALMTMSNDRDITSLCSTADNNLYAGTFYNGLYRSSNNGKDWYEIRATLPQLCWINVLSADSRGTLYAGSSAGILISNDSGTTWRISPSCLGVTSVTSIAIDREDRVFLGTGDAGVFESTDHGGSFKQIGLPESRKVKIFALGTDSRHNLYFSNNQGVYRKSLNDPCWRKVADGRGYENSYPAIGNDTAGNVLIGHAFGNIYRSSDGGETWKEIAYPFPIGYISCITKNRKGHIFVGNNSGIVVTKGDGRSWLRIKFPRNQWAYRISFNSQDHIYVAGYGNGPILSTDNGDSWIALWSRLENPRSYEPRFFGQLAMECIAFDEYDHPLIATGDGIYRSVNHEKNWTKLFSVPNQLVMDVIPLQDGLMVAATEKSGVFISHDSGASWGAMNSGLGTVRIFRMIRTEEGFLYVATDCGVYKSTILEVGPAR